MFGICYQKWVIFPYGLFSHIRNLLSEISKTILQWINNKNIGEGKVIKYLKYKNLTT